MRAVLNWLKMKNQGLEFRKETRELTKMNFHLLPWKSVLQGSKSENVSGVLNFWRSLHLYHEPILLGKRIRKLYVFQIVVWECSCSCFLSVFYVEIHQNNIFFYFLKIIFEISISKRSKIYKKLIFN
jgi:hypothetical protein